MNKLRTVWPTTQIIFRADKDANPRFVVTSLPARHFEKRYLYEDLFPDTIRGFIANDSTVLDGVCGDLGVSLARVDPLQNPKPQVV